MCSGQAGGTHIDGGAGATWLAVATAWSTAIIKIIPPLHHAYGDIVVTAALIVLPFIVGFSGHTTALVLRTLP